MMNENGLAGLSGIAQSQWYCRFNGPILKMGSAAKPSLHAMLDLLRSIGDGENVILIMAIFQICGLTFVAWNPSQPFNTL